MSLYAPRGFGSPQRKHSILRAKLTMRHFGQTQSPGFMSTLEPPDLENPRFMAYARHQVPHRVQQKTDWRGEIWKRDGHATCVRLASIPRRESGNRECRSHLIPPRHLQHRGSPRTRQTQNQGAYVRPRFWRSIEYPWCMLR